mgnify:CR=1 FL=1
MNNQSSKNPILRVARDLITRQQNPKSIPTVYFTDIVNVGDLLNEYLIPILSGKRVIRVNSSMTSHLRAVGSVIGSASRNSHIWGSGSIDGKPPNRQLAIEKIHAVRGEKTREMLSLFTGANLRHLPLGDPGILMSQYYKPEVIASGCIGIIPHFSDETLVKKYIRDTNSDNIKIISVRQQPEAFILDICACSYIFSSSLHGLILADSYSIPNKWISVSENLIGGAFKFEDYYSTTNKTDESCLKIDSLNEFVRAVGQPELFCKAKTFQNDMSRLVKSFPLDFTDKF